MNTISTISNISFNTPDFFELKIRELCKQVKGQVLDWAHWIVHQPDTDQSKAHIHFVCKPSRRVDTNWLRSQFVEPVPPDMVKERLAAAGDNITESLIVDISKPLGVLPFVKTSSMTDWLLYAVHDVAYLFKKGQSRNIRYERSDVKSTDPDFLSAQWEETADPLQALTKRVVDMYTIDQMSLGEIMQTGIIPPNLVYYFRTILEDVGGCKVKRRGKWQEPSI